MGRDLTKLPIFDARHANCSTCELVGQCERGMSCTAYRPDDFNGVMIVGEGPGQQEVTQRRPFVGKSGQLLRAFLEGSGLDMARCYITNATLGKPPPKDKSLHDAFPNAIPSCLGRLEAEIEAVQPTVIIALGAAAWIALSGRDEEKTKRVAFDCDKCNENRKVGPALQCNASVPNPEDGGKTSIPCHHSHFFQLQGPLPELSTSVDPDELAEMKAAGCQKCGASLKKLRPKMVPCLACGGYKMREEAYTEFTWDFNLTKIAGAVFEPAPGKSVREEHQLDHWYAKQGVKYVIATYHPSFLMRGQQFLAKTFNKHLINARRLLDGAQPVRVNHQVTADPEVLRAFIYRERDWSPLPGPNFAVDIETEAVIDEKAEDARKIRNVTKIKCIGFATATEQLVVDTRNVRPEDSDDQLLQAIYDVLVDESIAKTYHNGAGYDVPVIDLIWGIPWRDQVKSYHDDTLYAHKNLYPDEPHDLGHVTFESTLTRAWKPPRVSNGAQVHKDFDELALYNARDVHHTALSRDHIGVSHGKVIPGGRMDRANLAKVYSIDSRIRKITIGMTMNGMPLNRAVFNKAGEIASKNVADAVASIHTALKEAKVPNAADFNPNSGPQTIELLFGPQSFFKLTAVDRTDKGEISTSKTSLLKVMSLPEAAENKHALAVLNGLLTLRTQAYIDRNYVRNEAMQPWSDGRIHALWQPWGTKTGRMSSSPNVQNWPIWLRDAVEAANGRMIVGADADQLELRNIAHLSGDTEMVRRVLTADEKRKLEPDYDPHSFVASIAFGEGYTGLLLKDPTHTDKSAGGDKSKKCRCQTCQRKARRDLIKRVIYGLNYGAGAMTILEAIYDGGYEGPPITLEMVEHVQKVIFRTFPGIPRFRDAMLALAKEEQGIWSPLHNRRRIFPLPEALGGAIPATEIYNYPIQSYAGDLVNEMLLLFEEGLRDIDPSAFVIAQVHDAIYAECSEKHAEAVAAFLKECMTMEQTRNGLTMKYSASGKINKRWGALAA